MARDVRWGILSCGKISADFVKAMSVTESVCTAYAVAARSKASAQKFAELHGIEKVHESYEALVNDPDIDVVYIGSVADTHYKLAKMCLEAKKPTLVEKPLALNYDEAKLLVDLAREQDVFFMEGMWSRFFPAMKKARSIVDSGGIGDIVCVQGDFGWNTKDCKPDDRMWNPLSGGMSYDIAMYLAMLGQVGYRGATVKNVHAVCPNKRNGMDQTILANVFFNKPDDSVGSLQMFVTGQANTEERTMIQGTKGRITITPPAHTPSNISVNYDIGRGESRQDFHDYPLPDDSWAQWNYPRSIGFAYQIQEVNECIRNDLKESEHFTLDDSLQLAFIMDEILEQIGHEGWMEDKEKRNAAKSA
eukprot:CAMPEP_0196828054 /NCGR_PEP_ID=MMETSP1362-20130617/94478_1 /TAXON_ID=163516 /ORGANISM="Leptocylindrus danicus, Strain CCMP1856" /LENGTH=360 /DNA_ID=CAMNT_0042208715 /DNA_START=43 /DNA_END=1125 /DNA_ORIENTATION=+